MKLPGILQLGVLRWRVELGEVAVREEQLQMPHSILISERQEQEEMKRRRADHRDIAKRWVCPASECSEQVVLVPNLRSGSAKCPSCGGRLAKEGAWRLAAMVKLLTPGEPERRLTLEDGDAVVVGRVPDSATALDVNPLLPEKSRGKISRMHLVVRNQKGKVMVEDLGSSNGSEILLPADRKLRKRAFRPGGRMKEHQPVELSRGTRIRLGGTPLVLELSGRTFGR